MKHRQICGGNPGDKLRLEGLTNQIENELLKTNFMRSFVCYLQGQEYLEIVWRRLDIDWILTPPRSISLRTHTRKE